MKTKLVSRILIGGCVIILLGLAAYFYNQYRLAQKRLNNPQQAILDDVRALTKTVGKLMLLPNEDPTVATVSDVDKLKNQRFFANAQNGDKVLIFNDAKEAVLYRPSINKIIEIMPINIQLSPTPTQSGQVSGTPGVSPITPTGQPTPAPVAFKFSLRNGTTVTGLAKRYEAEVKGKYPQAIIVGSDNAKRRDYAKTILIAVSQIAQSQIQTVAGQLGISGGSLPQDETAPTGTDFLIIIGSDKAGSAQ